MGKIRIEIVNNDIRNAVGYLFTENIIATGFEFCQGSPISFEIGVTTEDSSKFERYEPEDCDHYHRPAYDVENFAAKDSPVKEED